MLKVKRRGEGGKEIMWEVEGGLEDMLMSIGKKNRMII